MKDASTVRLQEKFFPPLLDNLKTLDKRLSEENNDGEGYITLLNKGWKSFWILDFRKFYRFEEETLFTFKQELEKYEVPRVNKGLVAGIAGAVLNECLIRKLDGYCLLVTATAEIPDPEAAASMLTTVNRFLDVDVSIQPLIDNRSVIKKQLNNLAQDEHRREEAAREQGYRPLPFYV